jgi:preprotein translocase subunit YajC
MHPTRVLPILCVLALASGAALIGADAAPADAPGPSSPAAPGAAPSQPSAWPTFILMGVVLVFMWFVLIRPQRREEKRRKSMIEATKRGDRVETIGGAHGVVEAVGETTIDLRLGGEKGLVITFNKGAVSRNVTGDDAGAVATAMKK